MSSAITVDSRVLTLLAVNGFLLALVFSFSHKSRVGVLGVLLLKPLPASVDRRHFKASASDTSTLVIGTSQEEEAVDNPTQSSLLEAHIDSMLHVWQATAITSPSKASVFNHWTTQRIIGLAEAAEILMPGNNPVLRILLDRVRYHTCVHWILSYLTCETPPPADVEELADEKGRRRALAQWWMNYAKKVECRVRSVEVSQHERELVSD